MSPARRCPSPIGRLRAMTVLGAHRLARFAGGLRRPGRGAGIAGRQALTLAWRRRGALVATFVVGGPAAAVPVAGPAARLRLEFRVGLPESHASKATAAAAASPRPARGSSPRHARAVMIERSLLRSFADHVRLVSHRRERESVVIHRATTVMRSAWRVAHSRPEAAPPGAPRPARGGRRFGATIPTPTAASVAARRSSIRRRSERALDLLPRPVPRVFATLRLPEEGRGAPRRPPAPPMRPPELFWRAAPTEASGVAVERMAHGMAGLSSASGFASGLPARQAMAAPPSPAAAPAIDAATIDRIAHDVIGRVEKRARIERERRGL